MSSSSTKRRAEKEPISTLIQKIPALFGLPSTPAPSISSSDIGALFSSDELFIPIIIIQLFIAVWNWYLAMIPIDFFTRLTIPVGQSERSKLRSRVNWALCAVSWDTMIGIWHLQRDNRRLNRVLEGGGGMVADITIRPTCQTDQDRENPIKRLQRKRKTKPDDIALLEGKRGASPPLAVNREESSPSSSSSTPSVKLRNPRSSQSRAHQPDTYPHPSQPSQTARTRLRNGRKLAPPARSPASESEWFDVSPRRLDREGQEYDKISKWYSRSPGSSSDSSTSEASDHLPTPQHVPISLPSYDQAISPTPTKVTQHEPEDDGFRGFSRKSDRWLEEDCDPHHVEVEVKGLMSVPWIVNLVECVTAPVITLGLMIGLGLLVSSWWNWDPPEPSVVVS